MVNWSRGASWRNIGGGRPAFSNPDIARRLDRHKAGLCKKIEKANQDLANVKYAFKTN